jgi:hypothetical protein
MMTDILRRAAGALAVAALSVVPVQGQQFARRGDDLIAPGAPGTVGVLVPSGSRCLAPLSEALARRYGRILLWCGGWVNEQMTEPESRRVSGVTLRLPDNLDAARAIAALSSSEIVELSPRFILLEAKSYACREPLAITAEQAAGLGIPLDPSVDVHALEMRLFETFGRRSVGLTRFGSAWSGIFYWASREGRGRELYVLSQSTEDLSPTYIAPRRLAKVTVDGTGTDLTIRPLWETSCEGPATTFELDFDRDGVVDVMCFSGSVGNFSADRPLVVFSGATGKCLGKIDAVDEVVITEASSTYLIRTLGSVDDPTVQKTVPTTWTYTVKGDTIALVQERRESATAPIRGPLLSAKAASLDPARFGADERLVAHFSLGGIEGRGYHGIPPIRTIGASVPERNQDGHFAAIVHVLLDYQPAPKSPNQQHE